MATHLRELETTLEKLKSEALGTIAMAGDISELQALRVHYLGKKGALTDILKGIGRLDPAQRPLIGQKVNQLKQELTASIAQAETRLQHEAELRRIQAERIDVGLPGRRRPVGGVHPLQKGLDEMTSIFVGMGFSVAQGPEIEDEFHNFDALNIPASHPARAMHDTFFVGGREKLLLRTHTSPVQIRSMLNSEPPLAVVAPGRVFRCDHDVSHSPMFHQIEVFLVDVGVSMAHLRGVLQHFLSVYFGRDLPIRLRPSFFPFTEPSAEVDIGCVLCSGHGCRVCKDTGWFEVLGSGMIHPNVLKMVDIDPEVYSGFAFGLGVERLVMLKYGIPDLRLFFENDLRFLGRFAS